MKVWMFSVVVHLLLLWALMWVRFVPENKAVNPVVISTYSYTQVRPQPTPLIAPQQRAATEVQHLSITPAQRAPKMAAKLAKPTESREKATNTSAVTQQNTEQNLQPVIGPRSLAERALASAAMASVSPVAGIRTKPQALQSSDRQNEPGLTPAIIKEVKQYADGSLLVEGVHGCWKVPPAELRKGATWLATSTPCKADSTADQIQSILEKRRSYDQD